MRRFFVDTFYLMALSNRQDQWHRRVVTFSRALLDVRLSTVDEVLAAFLTFSSTSGAHMRTQAVRTVRHALDDPQWTVLPQSRTSRLDALTLYEARSDKEYSLTDCVSMQAMRREGLTDVLSNDHYFTQEVVVLESLIVFRERRVA
jgi:predicted nucleic acid-binding protein